MKNTHIGRILAVPVSVALCLSACGQSESTASDSTPEESETTAAPDSATSDDVIEVSKDLPVPEISIEIVEDSVSGQNLSVDLDNFTITPENASTEPVDGEGHLHLYIDGERTKRFYNEELHLDLGEGSHNVMVEVSANSHTAYGQDGEPIRAMASIDVPQTEDTEHDHDMSEMVDASELDPEPSVELEVIKDPMSGWNLHADVENFDLGVENVGGESVDGQGHLHVAIDGEKTDRLYGEWSHLSTLDEGDHEISVMLVTDDHQTLAIGDEPIASSVSVTVTAEEAASTGHDSHGDEDMNHDDESHDDEDKAADEGHGHGESAGSMSVEEGLSRSDADTEIEFAVVEGEVVTTVDGQDTTDSIKLASGSVVAIAVTSDVADQVHLHGNDILVDVTPDNEGVIVFTADIPGTLEVELEESGLLLANLEIS